MPQEILDEIVDNGGGDIAQMGNCALVCRSLRSRSQKHIFRVINIDTTERIIQLVNLIRKNSLIPKYLHVVHTSSQQFLPIHGIDTELASFLLLIRRLVPHSSLWMLVTPHRSDTPNPHPDPMNHISPQLLLYCLSVVTRLELDRVPDFPAVALLNFRNLSHLSYIHTTTHPTLLTIFSPQRMYPLLPSFFRSITSLEIEKIARFPGILISNCHALTHLIFVNTTLWISEVAAVSSRPQITHLTVSTFDLETIKTLVDTVVDLSRLQQLDDKTDFNHFEEDPLSTNYDELNQCYQYLLSESKYSLTYLVIFGTITDSPENAAPLLPCNLSNIPNLATLILGFNCVDSDQMNAPLYLHDILQTVDTGTTRIKLFSIQFNILLELTFTDEDGLIHLNFTDLPLLFSHGSWTDIGRVLSDLSYKGCTQFNVTICCVLPEATAAYKHIVSPSAEGRTLCAVIFRWLDESIVPEGLFNPAAKFKVQVCPDPSSMTTKEYIVRGTRL
ncbi:hypothetical protein HYPSUDRAFT_69297 [Hypholoma sublateritium FD-334 SS-4]|uniref:F-box domain-containing protein n=1 Tax=Hypholoma sublateritium (strain FD-334 SS-4) TaxID=945553 RepID=A0A0D2NKL5_HYPSF|nr:hypothetical protein HYPSUDRAFT_69297 [Hypholoma sublateritium FD-334 SS-4]